VWRGYTLTAAHFPHVVTVIQCDNIIPPSDELLARGARSSRRALAPFTDAAAALERKALPRLNVEQAGSDIINFGSHSAGPDQGKPVILLRDFG
jgi:hypothetical protein